MEDRYDRVTIVIWFKDVFVPFWVNRVGRAFVRSRMWIRLKLSFPKGARTHSVGLWEKG